MVATEQTQTADTTAGTIDLGEMIDQAADDLNVWDDTLRVEALILLKDRMGKADEIQIGSSVVSREDLQNEISRLTNGTDKVPEVPQEVKVRISDAVQAIRTLKFMLKGDLRERAEDVLKRRDSLPRIRVTNRENS